MDATQSFRNTQAVSLCYQHDDTCWKHALNMLEHVTNIFVKFKNHIVTIVSSTLHVLHMELTHFKGSSRHQQ